MARHKSTLQRESTSKRQTTRPDAPFVVDNNGLRANILLPPQRYNPPGRGLRGDNPENYTNQTNNKKFNPIQTENRKTLNQPTNR
ncbi:MAG: hypothetical protein PUC94_03530 [Bacteroidales bacterium]|nr:hypothetical protein [Bacteroidales bacterium]